MSPTYLPPPCKDHTHTHILGLMQLCLLQPQMVTQTENVEMCLCVWQNKEPTAYSKHENML